MTVSDAMFDWNRELAARRCGFRSRSRLHITASTVGRSRGLVLVDDRPIYLPARGFRLLVRLAAALVESDDGYVYRGRLCEGGGLVDEGYYSASSMEQVLSELRNRLAGALDVPATEYIETAGRRVRISAPRELLTFDDLSRHPDEKVRHCAVRLAAVNARPAPA